MGLKIWGLTMLASYSMQRLRSPVLFADERIGQAVWRVELGDGDSRVFYV